MKKYLLKISIVILSLLPLSVNAQGDGFFRNEKNSGNRGGTEITLNGGAGSGIGGGAGGGGGIGGGGGEGFNFGSAPQTENPSAPVGGGLLIMLAASAGYAFLKRKEAK